jgi:GGDEF domain-containing protein
MIDHFARPYQRELYGKKSCSLFMDANPLIADHETSLQELSYTMVQSDAHHLFNGFIITEHGRYLGMGTGHDLMREITQMQINAARYANPLTQLPGNVPINEHIDRLLHSGSRFWVCYCDLDHFKPFNDVYGYRKGDDVIQLTGEMLSGHCDPNRDFIGHIGGDDFMILFQSEDWEARCQAMLDALPPSWPATARGLRTGRLHQRRPAGQESVLFADQPVAGRDQGRGAPVLHAPPDRHAGGGSEEAGQENPRQQPVPGPPPGSSGRRKGIRGARGRQTHCGCAIGRNARLMRAVAPRQYGSRPGASP